MDKEEVLRNAHELIEYSEGMKIDEVRESPHRAAPSTVGRDFLKIRLCWIHFPWI
jgi:hypothetical protein